MCGGKKCHLENLSRPCQNFFQDKNMGYNISFGPVIEDEVIIIGDLANMFSISYGEAEPFFNSTPQLRELWSLFRKGDILGGDRVLVRLTPKMMELIRKLDPSNCCNKSLQKAMDTGLLACQRANLSCFVETS